MTPFLPLALSLLLQSTLLLLLGLLALHLTHRRGPAVQTLVGRTVLVGVALSVLLTVTVTGRVTPLWRVALPGPTPQQVASPPETGGGGVLRDAHNKGTADQQGMAYNKGAASSTPTAAELPTPALPASGGVARNEPGWVPALASLWPSVTALLLLWLALCQWHLTQLRRTATPLTSGQAADTLKTLAPHPPRLFTHPAVCSPFLAGVRRPAIFLPAGADGDFAPAALRAILAHELAHLSRRDNAWTLAARLLCALLWFQPLLWVVCRKLEQIAEDACDVVVLSQNCPPRAYADCLLTLAERHPLPRHQRALGAGVAPQYRSSLGRRVQRILTPGKHTMPPLTTKLRLTIAALTLTAVLGGTFLVSSAPAQVSTGKVSPDPARTQAALLIGIWLYQNQPISGGKEGMVTYSSGGKFTYLFPATAQSEPQQRSGTYALNDDSLMETMLSPTTITGLHFQVSGDTLTIRDGSGEVSVAKRLSATDADATKQRFLQTTDDLTQARFLAGLTAVQGPGVVVTLNDSKKPFSGRLPAELPQPDLIHDIDINQVVNELKSAGAEAIAVNNQRLVATSSVRNAGPVISINNVPQTPPYVIKAIGSAEAFSAALSLPGGIASQIKSYDPAMFAIKNAPILTLPAYSEVGAPRYAKPLTSDPTRKAEAQPKQTASRTPLEARRQALQLQIVRDQLALQQAAAQQQTTYAHLRDEGFFVQAAPDGSLRSVNFGKGKSPAPPASDESTDQIKILDQEIALQIAKIVRLEGSGDTPKHPDMIWAQAQLQALETARREAPIKAKWDFVKDVHESMHRQMAIYNKFVGTNLPLAAANRQIARDQEALKLLTSSIQRDKKL